MCFCGVFVCRSEEGLAFVLCVCVYERLCVVSFLVDNTEGGEAMAGLYSLQSSVSIIKEWYLQSGTGLKGRYEGGEDRYKKKKKEVVL